MRTVPDQLIYAIEGIMDISSRSEHLDYTSAVCNFGYRRKPFTISEMIGEVRMRTLYFRPELCLAHHPPVRCSTSCLPSRELILEVQSGSGAFAHSEQVGNVQASRSSRARYWPTQLLCQ